MGRTNSLGGPFQPQRRVLLGAACCALVGGATPAVAQALVLHVAVSARSPWRVVTSKELLALYTGRVRTLADGGPATPLDQRRDGSVRESLPRMQTRKRPAWGGQLVGRGAGARAGAGAGGCAGAVFGGCAGAGACVGAGAAAGRGQR
jgi:hypothetical protein